MRRWATACAVAALVGMLAAATIWSSAPPAARAQTAPDVRLREAPTPTSAPRAGPGQGPPPLVLRLSNATLEANRGSLPDGADLTLLAQPTYVSLPSAGPNLVRISPAVTITARGASGQAIGLSGAARLTFAQQAAATTSVYRLDGVLWRSVPSSRLGGALVVQPISPGSYAVFAELPPDWPLRHDALTAVALNSARLVVDDLPTSR